MDHKTLFASIILSSLLLISCRGSTKNVPPVPSLIEPTWIAGQFSDKSIYKDLCAVPRVGSDSNGDTFLDSVGTAMHEKMWLRSLTNETYLWYNEVDDNDPSSFTVANYFSQLKTNELTESGSFKDNFHFSQSTEEYNQRTQSGVVSGYGISWEFVSSSVPRKLIVRYTEPDSPAELANVTRGYELKSIDGIDFINGDKESDVDKINAALFPAGAGDTFNFVFTDASGEEVLNRDLTSANVELQPVQNVKVLDTPQGKLGYLQFNSFISAGQAGLIDGFQEFIDQNVTELVIDMRYNGGGLLAMASQLGYMIAGSAQTNNQIFETTLFNDKSGNINPVTGNTTQATPFYTREINWNTYEFTDQILPALDLTRVFVLSTGSTCSASEAVINGLKGIDVEVVLIGDTTCGKPYGFYAQDNCSTTYFTIQFKGVNAKNFGEYADGFQPTPTPIFEDELPGCLIEDDFSKALGDENEALLASAIEYAETGNCPVLPTAKFEQLATQKNTGTEIYTPNTIFESIRLQNMLRTPHIQEPSEH